jgi:hypothetical protein
MIFVGMYVGYVLCTGLTLLICLWHSKNFKRINIGQECCRKRYDFLYKISDTKMI